MMKVIRTSLKHNERFKEVDIDLLKTTPQKEIIVDTKKEAQTIIGFGGAFTESSAYNLGRVNKALREQAIKAYFDPKDGLGYTMGRVSIHGCDFSLGSYLYIDDYDDSLASFKIDRDQPVIDLIHDAQKIAKLPIKLIASPWTPPFWMKDNLSPIFGGKLLPKYDQVWANYFVKFIEAYEKAGTHIFAVTIQNEPMAKQRWDSCIFENEDECRFLKVLGPTLKKAHYEDKHILIWDHNRDVMVERASHIYTDKEAQQYAWGTAFHWYDQERFEEVAKHKELFPDKHLIFTEGCQENGPHFDDYAVGERYGRNMIHDLKNGTEAYVDWNLFLDDTGGPNHVNNLCSSPVMVKIFNEKLILNPSYYYVGHFSKYIKPGAVHIASSGTDQLLYVGFKNPNGEIVLIIQNQHDTPVEVTLKGFNTPINFKVIERSISTVIL